MASPLTPFDFPVRFAGGVASEVLARATDGRVAAVFDSSFYVETKNGLFCIGSAALEPGPLTLVTDAPAATKWPTSGVTRNATAHIGPRTVTIGNRYRYALSDAAAWAPDRISGAPDPAKIETGLQTFRRTAADKVPAGGLGRFLLPDFRPARADIVSWAAADPIVALRHWVISACRAPEKANAEDLGPVRPLIGLGPGLTPSGDDILGGVMIALHALQEAAMCRQLWSAVREAATQSGNAISLAHLAAAADGQGGAAVHRALAAIMQADVARMPDAVSGIDRIGHTSGWDAMTGAVIALDGWRAARHSRSCP